MQQSPLSSDVRASLGCLASAWGMDEQDQAVMYRQCEGGGKLADGSWISPEDARAFWLGETGAVH